MESISHDSTAPIDGFPAESAPQVPLPAGSSQTGPTTTSPPQPENGAPAKVPRSSPENHLLQVRLGIASSLFTALRAKHADTAAHSLRVTLNCAAWALSTGLSEEERDIIEVAALLHDVGKIGVPDSILLKPGRLTPDEMAVVEQHRRVGTEILRSSCASRAILDIVGYAGAWFNGSKSGYNLAGTDIPLGARMLAIADAFDAMTSDTVYRRALSRELAFSELFRYSGTQFDEELVESFAGFQHQDQSKLHEQVARRWLEVLDIDRVHSIWRLKTEDTQQVADTDQLLFPQKLLNNMREAVMFVDASVRIMLWNPGAERMTGIAADSIFQRAMNPSLLEMRDDEGFVLAEEECPVHRTISSGEQHMRRLIIRGRNQRDVSVEAHIVPVVRSDGTTAGATVLMRDVSGEMSLEARCHSLHEMATKDPLTQVANRAEFNRVHDMFVEAHLERKLPCSLIIADIDHFKSVNDTYGHPAGDEVLKGFAKVLKGFCRSGDLVARYGGEEFVMLCADCDNATAARRAEDMRRNLCQIPQHVLGGRNITASFGVTEIQHGDTPSTMLARADRGLYDAKERGRNTVVQLGTGIRGDEAADQAAGKKQARESNLLAEQWLVSAVPVSVAIQKLRGFVADHQGEVLNVDGNHVRVRLGEAKTLLFRRSNDRNVPFLMDLHFEDNPTDESNQHEAKQGCVRTRIHVAVSPQRNRDRRRAEAIERARQLMASLRAYLMATEDTMPAPPAVQRKTKNLGLPWGKKK